MGTVRGTHVNGDGLWRHTTVSTRNSVRALCLEGSHLLKLLCRLVSSGDERLVIWFVL